MYVSVVEQEQAEARRFGDGVGMMKCDERWSDVRFCQLLVAVTCLSCMRAARRVSVAQRWGLQQACYRCVDTRRAPREAYFLVVGVENTRLLVAETHSLAFWQ